MIDYQIKYSPEDFYVDELLTLENQHRNVAKYCYYHLEKKGYTTFEAIENILNFFKLSIDSIGYAGLKDEDAITKQHISVNRSLDEQNINEFNTLFDCNNDKYIFLRYIQSGDLPITIGNLLGNCFNIRLRNLSNKFLQLIGDEKKFDIFFINYYGIQRFGLPNQIKNTHHIGKAIINNDFKIALMELSKQNSPAGLGAKHYVGNPKDYFSTLSPNLVAFFQSAYYSHLWNNEIIKQILEMNINHQQYDLDGMHLYMPVIPKDYLRLMGAEKLKNIRVVYENQQFKKVEHIRSKILQSFVNIINIKEDEYNQNKYVCNMSFYLPSGSYATVLIPQFLQYLFSREKEIYSVEV